MIEWNLVKPNKKMKDESSKSYKCLSFVIARWLLEDWLRMLWWGRLLAMKV